MSQEKATFIQALFDVFLWILIFIRLYKNYKEPYKNYTKSSIIGEFLILVFCLFPFWGGDYFHYYEQMVEYNKGGYLLQEPVYGWLYSTFSFSYTFLRLIIWGFALFFLFNAYKRISSFYGLTLFFFGTCYMHYFSYARVSLSMSMVILGLTLLVTSEGRRRLLYIIGGVLIMGLSLVFHKSAFIGVVAAITALLLLNANKRTILLVILLTPLFIIVMKTFIEIYLGFDFEGVGVITNQYRDRLETGGGEIQDNSFGIGPFISVIFSRVPLYLSAIMYVVSVFSNDFKKFSIGERALSSFSFVTILIALVFLYDFGYDTSTIHYRILYWAMPANAVFLTAIQRLKRHSFLFKSVLYMTIIGAFYDLAYAAYCSLIS